MVKLSSPKYDGLLHEFQQYDEITLTAKYKIRAVLSQRLGLGKGSLRMAPEDSLQTILQVPLGCVTPFALINKSSQHVSLLLDRGLKAQSHCLFHPLSNDASISISPADLDKFLVSIGRKPSYVDFKATPRLGEDHPPDLAVLVPSEVKNPPSESSEDRPAIQNLVLQSTHLGVAVSGPVLRERSRDDDRKSSSNPSRFVDEILDKLSGLLISEGASAWGSQELRLQLANYSRRCLRLELESLAVMFKNTAYTEGFSAKGCRD